MVVLAVHDWPQPWRYAKCQMGRAFYDRMGWLPHHSTVVGTARGQQKCDTGMFFFFFFFFGYFFFSLD